MKPRQQVSRAAIELIERFEGYRKSAAQLDDGRWTIGYGHTKTARKGVDVSESDAEALLIYDLMEIAGALNDWIYTPLTQNQFDALAAFVFNVGLENFRHSGVLKRLNEGALLQAACAMEMWRKVEFDGEPIVVDALVRRRAAEKAMFLTPQAGFVPSPSPILRPKVDRDLTGAVPACAPVDVKTETQGDRAFAVRPGSLVEAKPAEAPSASQVAADAITARLQSILTEPAAPAEPAPAPSSFQLHPEPEPAPAAPQPGEAELDLPSPPEGAHRWTPAAEPGPVAPPAEPAPEPRLAWPPSTAEPVQEPEPRLFATDPMTFEDFESRRVAHHDYEAYSELDQVPVQPVRGFGPVALWLAMGAVGLIVFAAGIFFGFNAKNSGVGGYIGWGLGLVGIFFVATAVYFLLERLGGREEQ